MSSLNRGSQMNSRRNKGIHPGSFVFLAVMLVTLPIYQAQAGKTENCFLDIEPDVGVMWLHSTSTNHGTWVRAPQEINNLVQLEASWDSGFMETKSFSGDISYDIGDTETYINIHLACNAMTGDSNSVIWMYTKCSLSGNDPDSYTCSRLEGTDSFVVRAK